ncbi:hypothetical protein Aperf_G00000114986 [Anoplocephala perfoliata]
MAFTARIDAGDIIVIVAYFVIVFAVGIWSSLRNRGSVGGYFLAGRSMGWIPVGASLFASDLGATGFVGFAGNAASSGIAMGLFQFVAAFTLSVLGWLVLPVYLASGIVTMPEYLKRRFGGQRIRLYMAIVSLILYILTKISIDLYSGSLFIQQAMNLSLYPSAIILLIISALFSIMGGLTAVIYTDTAQTVIMLLGAVYLCIKNDAKDLQPDLYGNDADRKTVWDARDPVDQSEGIYAECSIPASDAMDCLRSLSSTSMPWLGGIFGVIISGIWYWCFDQVIVQRCLAAKNIIHAKAGCVMCIFLKITPFWFLYMPGMAARVLFADTVACGDASMCKAVCDKRSGCTDVAYPSMVLNLMPTAARGLMSSAVMPSLVSSLTSVFNSTSTIFTIDIWKQIRPRCRDAELMIVGRIAVLVLVGIGLARMPVVQSSEASMYFALSIISYISPPIGVMYVLAIFWPRTNESGAFWGLTIGLIIGTIRLMWEMTYPTIPCGEVNNNPPHFLVAVNYLHFAILLFGFSLVTTVVASLVTPPLPRSLTRRLVFQDRNAPFDPELDVPKLTIVSEEEKEEWIAEGEAAKPVLPTWRKVVNWFCGVDTMQDEREPVFTKEEAEEIRARREKETNLTEDPKQKIIVNVGLACSIISTIFFLAFFA